ncbi:HNH endonuclease signature motif containing protein [Mycolicibacterium sediminis]|uniref:HNH endonuclease n=1 Tax=Mycolicibacterium sediminis TaxID=1286180 RepID=A0A7I7QL66_9MYCO|nr:HNH endonuclease signature motif containing protein [Mycolicibacterium sediminis]BBY27014.1 HNH endonuclease [Mycolicibacterium sediminis]
MSSTATPLAPTATPAERRDELFDELAELTGQRNAIDGRIVDIIAEIDGDHLCYATGCRSISALVAWKTGIAPRNADTVVAIAHRVDEFPRCVAGLREGRLSLDQVGVIAEHAADGSDDHYADLAAVATVTQLRTAVKLEPRPDHAPKPEPPPPAFVKTDIPGEDHVTWKIRLPRADAATFEAAHQSHLDALITDWKRDRENNPRTGDQAPPMPTTIDAFMSLVEAGWDTDVARRPHGQRTTVVVHVDADKPAAALHLGPLLSDDERRELLCDATCEVWFQRHGQTIGAGRTTRTVSRRLRRVLEHRDRCCVVPGCGATRGLHAHHLVHWEDGGPTEPSNLVLLCPFHHRLHHRGGITLTGPAEHLVVTDADGRELTGASLARPPTTPPPDVPPCPGPLGERAQWWWYTPFEPPPTTDN